MELRFLYRKMFFGGLQTAPDANFTCPQSILQKFSSMIKFAIVVAIVIFIVLYCFYIKKLFIVKYVPSDRRHVLEEALTKRQVFPAKEWENYKIPDGQLHNILAIISYSLEWPNAHFIPSDKMADIMQNASFSLAHCEMLFLLKSKTNIDISKENLVDSIKNNDTLGDWLKNILPVQRLTDDLKMEDEMPKPEQK